MAAAIGIILNVIFLIVFLVLAIFGTLFISGKIETETKPNHWAYVNTVTAWIGFVIMLWMLIFI